MIEKLKSFVGEQARRSSLLKNAYAELDILRKYRTWRPEKVPLAGAEELHIYVNPREPRGRALLRSYCSGQRGLKKVWLEALKLLKPTLVIDVGANYGEFVFLATYEADAEVIAIEADPALGEYLARSCAEHPNCGQIVVHHGLAASSSGGTQFLLRDPDWSGRSSVVASYRSERIERVPVKEIAIDDLTATFCSTPGPLIFKIDVEGYESEVLKGMTRTLAASTATFGLLEFDARRLRTAGVDARAFLRQLEGQFQAFAVSSGVAPRPISDSDREKASDATLVTDLALVSEGAAAPLASLLQDWV